MASLTEIQKRLTFRKSAYDKLTDAYLAIADGKAKSYTIDDRTLTKLDLPDLKTEIEKLEREIDQLEALVNGGKPRRAVGIVPRDW